MQLSVRDSMCHHALELHRRMGAALPCEERRLQEAGCKEAALLWDEEHKAHAFLTRDRNMLSDFARAIRRSDMRRSFFGMESWSAHWQLK